MELSITEKLLLSSQYEILKQLNPARADEYDLLLTCLYDGYLEDFEQLIPRFGDPLSTAVRREVRNILEMFRAIHPGGELEPPAVFAGFDGNEEIDHYSYARFLLEERGLWKESRNERDDYNTHIPVLDDYRAMLEIWDQSADKINLSPDEIERIVEAAPFRSKPK